MMAHMGWGRRLSALGLGLVLTTAGCAQRDLAPAVVTAPTVTAPTFTVTTMPGQVPTAVTAPHVQLPTITPHAAATAPPEDVLLLPTPTPGPLHFTSVRGGYRLQLPVPWRAHTLSLTGDEAALVELAAVRLEAATSVTATMTATMSAALVEAHGLTLAQWRDATAAALVLAGFELKDTGLDEAGGAARIPVARITYQLPRTAARAPVQMGIQLAWFAPDDQIVVLTFVTDRTDAAALLPEVDQLVQTLTLTAEATPAAP